MTRKILHGILLLFLLHTTILQAQQTAVFQSPKPLPDPDKWYFIEAVNTGLVITVPNLIPSSGINYHNNNRVKLRADKRSENITDYQQWRFIRSENFPGFFRIVNKGSNLVMELATSSPQGESFLHQFSMGSAAAKDQFFKPVFACNENFFLVSNRTGLVITIEQMSSPAWSNIFNGMNMVTDWFVRQLNLGTSNFQTWRLVEAN